MSALVESRGTAYTVRSPRFSALTVITDAGLRADVIRSLQALGASEVVEVSLPDGSGVSLIAELRTLGWQRGIALAAEGDPFSVRGALAAGVRGFLVTDTEASAARRGGSLPRGIEDLSAREVEVLQLVAGGRSNRDIGEVLHLSALTVKSHLARISRKLGTGDRAEMVALALRAGVIR